MLAVVLAALWLAPSGSTTVGDAAAATDGAGWARWDFRARAGGIGSARWDRVTDPNAVHAALEVARAIPRSELEEGYPSSCELRVLKRVTPDFDGDRKLDALYRFEWVVAADGSAPRCPSRSSSAGNRNVVVILARSGRRPPAWLLWHASDGDVTADVSIGRLASGRPVILVEDDMSESDTDCLVRQTRVIDPASDSGPQELFRTVQRSGCPSPDACPP
jgi:hypothetical protein